MIPEFYVSRPEWPDRIEQIIELLGRVSVAEQLSGRLPELRRTNRIASVHSSTAIEGSVLTLAQVADLVNGAPALAPPLGAYEARALAGRPDVGVNVGVNVGVTESILTLLRSEPTLSAALIAQRLAKTSRTVERHLARLKRAGRIRRQGSAKGGRWVVLDG